MQSALRSAPARRTSLRPVPRPGSAAPARASSPRSPPRSARDTAACARIVDPLRLQPHLDRSHLAVPLRVRRVVAEHVVRLQIVGDAPTVRLRMSFVLTMARPSVSLASDRSRSSCAMLWRKPFRSALPCGVNVDPLQAARRNRIEGRRSPAAPRSAGRGTARRNPSSPAASAPSLQKFGAGPAITSPRGIGPGRPPLTPIFGTSPLPAPLVIAALTGPPSGSPSATKTMLLRSSRMAPSSVHQPLEQRVGVVGPRARDQATRDRTAPAPIPRRRSRPASSATRASRARRRPRSSSGRARDPAESLLVETSPNRSCGPRLRSRKSCERPAHDVPADQVDMRRDR